MPLSVRAALTPPTCADGAAPQENRAGDIPRLGKKHHAGHRRLMRAKPEVRLPAWWEGFEPALIAEAALPQSTDGSNPVCSIQ